MNWEGSLEVTARFHGRSEYKRRHEVDATSAFRCGSCVIGASVRRTVECASRTESRNESHIIISVICVCGVVLSFHI